MQLTLRDNLPFVTVILTYKKIALTIPNVLVDTGSARTIFSADIVLPIHITPEPDDVLYTIRGVGGSEVVFTRQVDSLQVDNHQLLQFEIEVGGMDYGFEINGILGMNFLQQASAILNLAKLNIIFPNSSLEV